MFDLREFIKDSFMKAIGDMPDYKIKLNAAGWFEKGVLNESDLEEIQNAINAKSNDLGEQQTEEQ